MDLHPTSKIIDSTKLQAFQTCPRKYFYEYILGWRQDTPSHHLHFGSAMHKALEYIHQHPDSFLPKNEHYLMGAFDAFLQEWRKHFSEDCDQMFWPKTPMNLLSALTAYCMQYSSDRTELDVKYTEISGTVPIGDDRLLHFRMDTLYQERSTGLFSSLEHKSASSEWNWSQQWPLKIQIGTYSHVLHCLYPPSEVGNVVMNGIFFKKNKTNTISLQRFPIHRTEQHLQQWLWTVNDLIDSTLREQDFFLENDWSDPDELFQCFPLNGESCLKYGICPFHDFCCAWINPWARSLNGPPPGYNIEWWDPSAEDSSTKMDLTTGDIRTQMKP